jgi:hypothetical protein
MQQFSAPVCVDQRHMAFVYAQGLELRIAHFVFGVYKGVADGVEVVAFHRRFLGACFSALVRGALDRIGRAAKWVAARIFRCRGTARRGRTQTLNSSR